MPASGTSVCRIRPDSGKMSMAPERTCDSMSVSPPSWLLGKIWISTLPPLSFFTASAASRTRMLEGWVVGMLLAHLNTRGVPWANSGAPMVASAPAVAVARINWRRLREMSLLMGCLLWVSGGKSCVSVA